MKNRAVQRSHSLVDELRGRTVTEQVTHGKMEVNTLVDFDNNNNLDLGWEFTDAAFLKEVYDEAQVLVLERSAARSAALIPVSTVYPEPLEQAPQTHTRGTNWYVVIAILLIVVIVGAGLYGSLPRQESKAQVTSKARVSLPAGLPNNSYVRVAWGDALDAHINPVYFVRQINQESGFNPNSLSPAGAEGIAQFMPATAAGIGINPWDPIQALRGAAQYMAAKLRLYDGDYAKALASYNAGDGAVQMAVNACGEENWLACTPAETRRYVHNIMNT